MKRIFFIIWLLNITMFVFAQRTEDANTLYQHALSEFKKENYSSALSLIEKAAEKNHPTAQAFWGTLHYLQQDYNIANFWLDKAAAQEIPYALCVIGSMYYEGKGRVQNNKFAFDFYSKAAEKEDVGGLFHVGVCYYEGCNVKKDYSKAKEYFLLAVNKKFDETLGILEKNRHLSYVASGERFIGYMYEQGLGVEQDWKMAHQYYLNAADKGDATAQFNIGSIYYNGNEKYAKDYHEAFKWIEKSAEKGVDMAQNLLGYMFMNGWGCPQNYEKALFWYSKSANHGNDQAMNNIGYMYLNGYGVGIDYNEAKQWYEKAAEQGNAIAYYNIGDMYESGIGVKKDYGLAKYHYKKALSKGYNAANKKIEILNLIEQQANKDVKLTSSSSNKCYAIVIGNEKYSWSPLYNPCNDARAFAEKLKNYGFKVMTVYNTANRKELEDSIISFSDKAKDSDVSLFYYSGHAFQYEGRDYLIPLIDKDDFGLVNKNCTSLEWIIKLLKDAGIKDNILILDACRSAPSLKIALNKGFSQNTGLAVERGICIVYATQSNSEAYEGKGNNSPFMKAILSGLSSDDISLDDLFIKKVRWEVQALTESKQIPVIISNLHTEFHFVKK